MMSRPSKLHRQLEKLREELHLSALSLYPHPCAHTLNLHTGKLGYNVTPFKTAPTAGEAAGAAITPERTLFVPTLFCSHFRLRTGKLGCCA